MLTQLHCKNINHINFMLTLYSAAIIVLYLMLTVNILIQPIRLNLLNSHMTTVADLGGL